MESQQLVDGSEQVVNRSCGVKCRAARLKNRTRFDSDAATTCVVRTTAFSAVYFRIIETMCGAALGLIGPLTSSTRRVNYLTVSAAAAVPDYPCGKCHWPRARGCVKNQGTLVGSFVTGAVLACCECMTVGRCYLCGAII